MTMNESFLIFADSVVVGDFEPIDITDGYVHVNVNGNRYFFMYRGYRQFTFCSGKFHEIYIDKKSPLFEVACMLEDFFNMKGLEEILTEN